MEIDSHSPLFDKEVFRNVGMFHYYIIMPAPKNKDIAEKAIKIYNEMYFNKFDENILNSVPYLRLISSLPATLDEYHTNSQWPLTINKVDYDTNYQIHFLYEQNVNETTLEMIRIYPYGLVCILPGVSSDIEMVLESNMDLPIIRENGDSPRQLSLEAGVIEKIHDIWRTKHECWEVRVDTLEIEHKNLIDWTSNKTNLSSYRGPATLFMDPLTATIDRIRGLYSNTLLGRYQPIPTTIANGDAKEREADIDMLAGLKNIIAEKFLTLMLGFIAEKSFDIKDRYFLTMVGLVEGDLLDLLRNPQSENYERCVQVILDNFPNLDYRTDMVVCVPSVNYLMLNFFNSKLREHAIPKKILRAIYDQDTYYGKIDPDIFEGTTPKKKKDNIEIFLWVLERRAKEMALLSHLHVFYSLSCRNPYFRTRNFPAQQFYQIASALTQYSYNMEARNKVPEFINGIRSLSNLMRNKFSEQILSVINKHGAHIKILSDLPLEWMEVEGLPLCVAKAVSRVPITPGNGLIAHSNVMCQEYIINRENLSILIINALDPDDEIFNIGRGIREQIQEYCDQIGRYVTYFEVKSAKEYIDAIEKVQPSILIHYGHGTHCMQDMIGKLMIGKEDELDAMDVEKINWKPPIVILGACSTQVMHGTHLNIANLFLGSGCLSVLGSFFPVDAVYTASFIVRLIRHLVNCLNNSAPEIFERWDDVVLQTYRTHYLLDAIHSLSRYLSKRKIFLKEDLYDSLKRFFEYCNEHHIELLEQYRRRDEILLKVFEDNPVLVKAYESIVKNSLIVPEALFYSSLGSPEKIRIDREGLSEEKVNVKNMV